MKIEVGTVDTTTHTVSLAELASTASTPYDLTSLLEPVAKITNIA